MSLREARWAACSLFAMLPFLRVCVFAEENGHAELSSLKIRDCIMMCMEGGGLI